MNRKAMMDDFFDFIFTVFAAFFILLFLWLYVSSSQRNNEAETNKFVYSTEGSTNEINNYRFNLEKGEEINMVSLQYEISFWREKPSEEEE